ncbi:MAG: DNA replication and repair protein RecF [Solirubrobacterales bacterium]
MLVTSVAADRIRSLDGVKLELNPQITAVVGPNGAGKTNLVEAIYFGLAGRSFRTGDRRDLIPFGSPWARSTVRTDDGRGSRHEFMAAVSRNEGTRFNMDGAPIERSSALNYRPMVTVFSPDRLEIVKGPPATRRAHLDSWVAARWPGRSELRAAFGRALAQRNALLSRIASGSADGSQLGVWNRQVAETGAELSRARAEAVEALSGYFEKSSADLGLEGSSTLSYRAGAVGDPDELERGLEERVDTDLRLGRTSWGPHHDELRLELGGRQLRRFGSQGQQRIGLLSLFFAERDALLESGADPPLMLLDDVMSELDAHRRELLVERLLEGGQSVITAAESELVPEREGVGVVPIQGLLERTAEHSVKTTGADTG